MSVGSWKAQPFSMDAENETTPQSTVVAVTDDASEVAQTGAQVGGPEVAAAHELPEGQGESPSGPRVSVGYPGNRFDSGVDGVGVIAYRTPVPKAKLKAVKEAAEQYDVRLVVED